jgi:hypothetical protein
MHVHGCVLNSEQGHLTVVLESVTDEDTSQKNVSLRSRGARNQVVLCWRVPSNVYTTAQTEII